MPEAPPWPPLRPAGQEDWPDNKADEDGMGGTTTNGTKDRYAAMMARLFPVEDDVEEADEWLQPRPPPCPGWGLAELAEEGFEDKDTYCDYDCELTTGPDDPMLVYGDEDCKREEDTTTDQLLLEAKARQREVEASLRKAKEKSRKRDEELLRLKKKDAELKMSMERQLEDFQEQMESIFAAAEAVAFPVGPTIPPEPPSPHTWAPVTYAGLLFLDEEEITKTEMMAVVGSLLAPQPRDLSYDGEVGGGCRRPTTEIGTTAKERGLAPVLAGTDVRRHQLPPDGCAGFCGPAGTNERSFRRPPDLGRDRWPSGTNGWGLATKREFDGAMDVRQFCKPPDPGLGDMGMWCMLGDGLAGTTVHGFRVPPDG